MKKTKIYILFLTIVFIIAQNIVLGNQMFENVNFMTAKVLENNKYDSKKYFLKAFEKFVEDNKNLKVGDEYQNVTLAGKLIIVGRTENLTDDSCNKLFGKIFNPRKQEEELERVISLSLVKSICQFYEIKESELVRIIKNKKHLVKKESKEIFDLFSKCIHILNEKIEDQKQIKRQIKIHEEVLKKLEEKNEIYLQSIPTLPDTII